MAADRKTVLRGDAERTNKTAAHTAHAPAAIILKDAGTSVSATEKIRKSPQKQNSGRDLICCIDASSVEIMNVTS